MAPFRSLLLAALLVSTAGLAMGDKTFTIAPGATFDDFTCTGCTLDPVKGPTPFFTIGGGCTALETGPQAGMCTGTCSIEGCNPMCMIRKTAPSTLSCGCIGGACGDPHFYNQGVSFDFHGLPDHEYCLISDEDFALNTHMVGQDVTTTGETGTWMSRLGFLYNFEGQTHKVTLALQDTEDQSTTTNVVILTVDGAEIPLFRDYIQEGLGLSVSIDDEAESAYIVDVKGHMSARITVSEHTAPDGFNFDFSLRSLQVSPNVHGVLGQTYQAARASDLQAMAESSVGSTRSYTDADVLEGAEGDYEVSGLFETDFKFNRFVAPNGALVMSGRKLLVAEEETEKAAVPFRITMTGNSMRLHDH